MQKKVREHNCGITYEIPSDVIAFNFNLYEDINKNWSMELVGTESFDVDDEDWACDEVTDFGTRDNPFCWHKEAGWNEVLEEIVSILKEYLNNGAFSSVLKNFKGVGVGFADGDIEILHYKRVF